MNEITIIFLAILLWSIICSGLLVYVMMNHKEKDKDD